MPTSGELSAYVLAELRARESWKNRDYGTAHDQAREAARLALESGDESTWWNMTYLQAECLRDAGESRGFLEVASTLAEHPLSHNLPGLQARSTAILGAALRGVGRLAEAAVAASSARDLVAEGGENVKVQVEAQRVLIASLAESRRLDEAWQECLELEMLLTDEVDEDTAGKAYWVIGNVAFLCDKIEEGGDYHDMAAERLSPSKDVNLWARFNKASALMRLEAQIADAATLRCIERAELATHVVGGTEEDRLELTSVRGHWSFLTGDTKAAIELLGAVCAQSDRLPPQTAADASFLLAKALIAQGNTQEALHFLHKAAALFDEAEAPERSAQVRAFSASVE
jgi:tetratricopeptide (TPR) repeat protein